MRPNNKDLLISFADSHGNITYEFVSNIAFANWGRGLSCILAIFYQEGQSLLVNLERLRVNFTRGSDPLVNF